MPSSIVVYENGAVNEFPVAAGEKIYAGVFVGANPSGEARTLVAGDKFLGISQFISDNTDGQTGDKTVIVRFNCFAEWKLSGATLASIGNEVYASDEITLTTDPLNNTRVGSVHRYVSPDLVIVKFRDGSLANVPLLIDNANGIVAQTVEEMPAVYDAAELNNALSSMVTKINSILQNIRS